MIAPAGKALEPLVAPGILSGFCASRGLPSRFALEAPKGQKCPARFRTVYAEGAEEDPLEGSFVEGRGAVGGHLKECGGDGPRAEGEGCSEDG